MPCLIEVFSSSGEVKLFIEVSDIRSAGCKDALELDTIYVGYQMKYLDAELKRSVVCELHGLIRKRNVEADLPVPAEVGCYAIGSTLFIVFR